MAVGAKEVSCTVVLHDDAVSTEDALCGANVLHSGDVAYLVTTGAKTLCIQGKNPASNPDDVSVHVSVAKSFGFQNRMKGSVQLIDDVEAATATHLEVFFRDQDLSRADMWRIKSQIDSSVLYEGQKLSYLGSDIATVEAVYIDGRQVLSAIIAHPRTKLIFRSISARFTLLLQISKEMFVYGNGGDLMYESMITGFLSELFQRWEQLKARHQVSVVLFGRRIPSQGEENVEVKTLQTESNDFYHPLVLDIPGSDWREVLSKIKKAFNNARVPRQVSLAARGNMLEAIHLATTDFVDSKTDPRLASTNTSVIAITAGAGLFHADYDKLRSTTDLFMGSNIGVDIVHLSPKPLHPVPLFEYMHNGHVEFALPHWVDISYWTPERSEKSSQWLLDNTFGEVNNISIARLEKRVNQTTAFATNDLMDAFDEEAFYRASSGIACRANASAKSSDPTITSMANGATERLQRNLANSTNTSMEISQTDLGLQQLSSGSTSGTAQSTKAEQTRPSFRPPLIQSDRKISLGPRGLAPSIGIASTTVSAQHVQQDRETGSGSPFAANETTSGLARQIKASLRKKPSQQTLESRVLPEAIEISKLVDIRTAENQSTDNSRDPASLMEEAIMQPAARSLDNTIDSSYATPKAHSGAPFSTVPDIVENHHNSNPWLTLMNPCNPRKANMQVASEYRQWQHVFPRAVSSDIFKWKSMCSPATLPLLAEGRFSLSELEKRFHKRVRRLLATHSSGQSQSPAQSAMWQIICVRLNAGFQIVPLRKPAYGQMASEHLDRILLSLGDQYHELKCLSDSELQITEYQRESGTETSVSDVGDPAPPYDMRIRPAISNKEQVVRFDFTQPLAPHNWSRLDDQCMNGIALTDNVGLSRMRFVLIPVEIPRTEGQGTATTRELSDDERRLDAIQKLTQIWQRNRYFTNEDQQHQAYMSKPKATGVPERDPNPLAIEYQTRDASAVVAAYGLNLSGQIDGVSTTRLFSESEQYHTSNFDIVKLVKQLQEPPPDGVEFRDRRWLTRLHLKCFRGDEMTNWLLRVFKDVQTREDAVTLGNQLMHRDIFTHVRGKHEFRDGNYFYQIRAAHRTTDYPDTAGFFSKPLGRSVPSTPVPEQKQLTPTSSADADSESAEKGIRTPSLAALDQKKKKEVLLSQKLQYNVDPGKKSSQLEVVNLHYYRIHNPENCYHISLDWTSTTPKLIRESVARWSALVDSHGLKLVQLPIHEASKIHQRHPFDQPVSIKLASRPPDRSLATPQVDPQSFSPRAIEDRDGYHKTILRRYGFVLDLESAKSFPRSVNVSYSWGKPDYQYTQFVHKSGRLLVQIVNDGEFDFLLLPNRLAQLSHIVASKRIDPISMESIVQDFVSFCRNKESLVALFEELDRSKDSTPFGFANALIADNDVPPMELPPHLSHRALLKRAG